MWLTSLSLVALMAVCRLQVVDLITLPTNEARNQELYTEIYNGEHFDDLVFSIDEVVRRNGLVVLYRPADSALLEELGLAWRPYASFPGEHQVILMRYDVKTYPLNTWYQYMAQHALVGRLGATKFPSLVWIPQGESPDTIRTWPRWTMASGVTWREWLKERIVHTVAVVNEYNEDIVLSWFNRVDGPKAPRHNESIAGKSTTNVQMLLYSIVAVCDGETGEFLTGFEVNVDTQKKIISAENKLNQKEEDWLRNTKNNVQRQHIEAIRLRSAHAIRHILLVKQPLFVPNITQQGYVLTKLPEHVHKDLLEFYDKKAMGREDLGVYWTAWNQDEVLVSHASLDGEETRKITEAIHPIVEEWCSCKVKPTTGRGVKTRVREYKAGTRIRMHVDELTTGHIIGTIMQVTKDLNGAEDWPLELVGFDGVRKRFYTNPGDLVIFESSKIIHGRPSVFRGKAYVNSFVYFQPVEGFEFTANMMDITHGDEVLSVTPFTTMPSRRNVSLPRRDEL